jgi:Fur family ferric uptake transcriptional regulator
VTTQPPDARTHRPDGLEAALETRDLRLTGPRRAVVALVAGRGAGHFSAADLIADANRRGIRIGRATIFRTLDLLQSTGVVERIDLPDGDHAYVSCRPSHHHHVVCTTCGRSRDVGDLHLQLATEAIELATGFHIEGHRLELYGTCGECAPVGPSSTP